MFIFKKLNIYNNYMSDIKEKKNRPVGLKYKVKIDKKIEVIKFKYGNFILTF